MKTKLLKKLKYKQLSVPTVILLVIILLYENGLFSQFSPTSENHMLEGAYKVERVVDGDTIIVNIDGESTKVRLIGVDTPESVHPDKSKNTEEGVIASEWVKEFLYGKNVFLEYDVSRTDYYNRVLAYVYLDEKTMVQRELLEAGLATVMTVQPNSKYADEFYKIQVKARENNVGLWGRKYDEEAR